MARYLFICSEYGAGTDANGICVKNIVEQLLSEDNYITILSEADKDGILVEQDKLEIYGIRKTWFSLFLDRYGIDTYFSKLIRIIRGIVVTIIYPNVSPLRGRKVFNLAKSLLHEKHYDFVVCVYRPFESLKVGLLIKNNDENVMVIGYHLDLLMSPNTKSRLLKNYKQRRARWFIRKEQKQFDLIVLPKSEEGKKYHGNKIGYADFPLLVRNINKTSQFEFSGEYLNLAYIGSIDGKNRKVDYLIEVLREIQKKSKTGVMFHVWGKISELVSEQLNKSGIAVVHGEVDNEEVFSLLTKSDFVVNLSNTITYDMVPSKIFQLFATGKPIINFVERKDDCSLDYFQKNDFVCNIYSYNHDIENDALKTINFLQSYKGRLQDERVVDELYLESTPAYFTEIIRMFNE